MRTIGIPDSKNPEAVKKERAKIVKIRSTYPRCHCHWRSGWIAIGEIRRPTKWPHKYGKSSRPSIVLMTLRHFTPTLVKQTLKPQELVIVDAGTIDTIEPMLRQELEGSGIDLYISAREPGTSSQRNKGIKVARGDFYFFFDDDVLLEDDYIEKSMACFDNAQELPLPLGGVRGNI